MVLTTNRSLYLQSAGLNLDFSEMSLFSLIFNLSLHAVRYGVEDTDRSAKKIHKAALSAPDDHFLILLAHNGPTGEYLQT